MRDGFGRLFARAGGAMFLVLWFTLSTVETFDDATPSLEVVKAAFKLNAERIANQRIKYVKVKLAGAPKKDIPPLDHPDRGEHDFVAAKDGRWRHHLKLFREDSLMRETISAWDGIRFTRFNLGTPANSKAAAEMRSQPNSEFDRGWLDLGMARVIDELGIRSRIQQSPLGERLVDLFPRVDSRVGNDIYVLDPSKNYWLVMVRNNSKGTSVEPTKYGKFASEFSKSADGWWYPKRVALAMDADTFYFTVVSAEFPRRSMTPSFG